MKNTNSKRTKRAFLFSVLSTVICVAMLIGTTFAWFTDTDTVSASAVKSGNFDVELVDAEGNEISELTWKTADNRETEILWEPGCTYELQPVKVKNNGDLALRYKLTLTGINGSEKLNEVIKWTVKLGDSEVDLKTFEGTLEPAQLSDELTISGHMDEAAGNEYMNQSIESVAVTVDAAQYTYEKDSKDDQYDKDAQYLVKAATAAELKNGLKTTGYVELSGDVSVDNSTVATPKQPVLTVAAAENESVTVTATNSVAGVLRFLPTGKNGTDELFSENDEFTLNLVNDVTLVNETGTMSVLLGNHGQDYSYSDKTFNINGGTFKTYSGQNNGAIYVATLSDSTINISDATFIAGKSGSAYGSYIVLNTYSSYGYNPTNMTVNFTNCTFKIIDGDTEKVLTAQEAVNTANLFYGFGGDSGNKLVIDGKTVIE